MEIEPWGYRLYEAVRHEGGSDIDALYTYMTGSFSSRAQAEADSEYLDIGLEMVPIWSSRSDGYWLYGRPWPPISTGLTRSACII
jgi:hypothetical protein